MSKFICDVCNKSFIHSGSLYNHKKSKHSYLKFQCDLCSFFSDTKSSLVRHKKNKHSNLIPTKRPVKCTLCSEFYFSKMDVVDHYIKHHNISIGYETLEFTNEDDFYIWKSQVEKKDGCEYIRKQSKYVSKVDGTTKITFFCHRNGTFKSKSENKRRIKKFGSNKIDGHCPAKIACSFHILGKISAVFCKNHVGHQPEIARMRLSSSDKKTIANKIASKIPFDEILEDIRLPVNTSEIDRLHLITRKDLLNIKQQYNLNNTKNKDVQEATKKHKADLILQFLNIIDKAKTEEDFNIILKHIQPILPTIEAQQTNTHTISKNECIFT